MKKSKQLILFSKGCQFRTVESESQFSLSLFLIESVVWTLLSIELKVPVVHSKKSCPPLGSLQEWYGGQNEWVFTLLH